MRRKIGVAVAVVLVALVFLWWKSRGGDGETKAGAGHGSAAATAKATEGTGGKAGKERAKQTPASLSGRVTRADNGSGVAGAVVSISTGDLLPKFIKADERPTQIAVTDATGAWKVERVMPGAYRVAATAKGFLPAELAKLTVAAGEHKSGLELELATGGTLVSGTVTDVGGGPVADARITAVRSGIRELRAGADYVTTTGPDGRYELTLPTGEIRMTATHDDYAKGTRMLELEKEPITVDFQLIPGATIRGQVVGRDSGKPVSGGLIRAETEGLGEGGDGLATVDAEGNFVMRGLTSGEVELNALGPGYTSQSPTIVSIGIGEQLEGVKVLVDQAFSITGRVVRKGKTAEGIPGITIGAFSIAAKSLGLSLEPSDEDGAFEIVGVKKGTYNLFAFGEGSVPEIGKVVEVVDHDVKDVIVELDAGVTISGRVEPPAPEIAISIAPTGPIGFANMFEVAKSVVVNADTDASGSFVLRNVPAGAFKLEAHAQDGRAGSTPLVVAQVDQAGLVVKLDARASVSGRVVDTSGKAVADVHVRAHRRDGEDQQVNFNFNGRNDGVTTKPDGSFTIVGLDAGKHEVIAHDGGAWWADGVGKKDKDKSKDKSAETVELAAGATRSGIVLEIEARDGVIRGVVIAPDGKPAQDAWVTATRTVESADPAMARFAKWSGDRSKPVLTSADGQFTITRLRKGTFNLDVEGPRGASRAMKPGVKPGETVTIKLASLGSLAGKVTAGGQPVTKFKIECEGPKDAEKYVEAADGTYTLERLAPGAYECEVEADAGTGEAKVEVGTEKKQLDITLIRWATVTGLVVDVLTKKPVPGLIVMGGPSGRGDSQAFSNILAGKAPTTDQNGRFTLDRIPVGKGTVSLMPKDGFTPLGSREYTASEGQRIDMGTIEVVSPRTGDAGTFGFSTNVDADKLMVTSVSADGPAKAAGVVEGDRITAINGQDVATLTPGVAKLLLSSGIVGVGQTVALSLDRAGTPVQVSVTSVKW